MARPRPAKPITTKVENKPAQEIQEPAEPGFWSFLREKPQQKDLMILGGIYVLLNVLIFFCYPYPMCTDDTTNYIHCAQLDLYGGYRPMGYSWFLQFFHAFSNSFSFIGFAQFWFNALATAFFLLNIKFFFPPKNKLLFYGFVLAVILSPVTLYLTNWVMSDSIFVSLTLLWLTSGLWLLHKFNWLTAAFHLIVMVLAIQVRFVGLFYPVLTALAMLYVYRFQLKALAVIAGALFLTFMIHHSVKKTTRELFLVDTFSGFSGWAQANNAVAIIPHIDLKPEELKDPEMQMAHHFVTQAPDTFYNDTYILRTWFIWKKDFAGKQILNYNMQQRFPGNYLSAWIYTGTMLNKYATYLMTHYPVQFFKHFVLLNFKQLFYPEITLHMYRVFPVNETIKNYYDTGTLEKFEARFDLVGEYIYPVSRVSCLALWLIMLGVAIYGIINLRKMDLTKKQKTLAMYLGAYALLYIGFSVIAHPIHLRYLMPLHALQISFMYIILNAINKHRKPISEPTVSE
jgi:hypothetical protein